HSAVTESGSSINETPSETSDMLTSPTSSSNINTPSNEPLDPATTMEAAAEALNQAMAAPGASNDETLALNATAETVNPAAVPKASDNKTSAPDTTVELLAPMEALSNATLAPNAMV
ncbi:hypothetical protein H0H92_002340, partial [Tricholoma furcatifolium]